MFFNSFVESAFIEQEASKNYKKTGSLRPPNVKRDKDNFKKLNTAIDKTPDFSKRFGGTSTFLSPNIGQDDENLMLESLDEDSMDNGFEDDLPRIDSNQMKPDLCEISEEDSRFASRRYGDPSGTIHDVEENKRKI